MTLKTNNATRVAFRGLIIAGAIAFLSSWTPLLKPELAGAATPSVVETAKTRSGELATARAAEKTSSKTAATTVVAALEDWDAEAIGAVDPDVFRLALNAATTAVRKGVVDAPSTLTVIDYSKPSSEKRMWVYDLRARSLLYEELVAHGQGSGGNVATQFSNEPETHRTSIGLFVTDDAYYGKNGYSLRLNGLDRGYNDRARERAIVIHGAPYVSPQFVKSTGRLGRSWGCPAVREPITRELIDRVKGGSLVFSYYPDPKWLRSSEFLRAAD